MLKRNQKKLFAALFLLAAFVLWTLAVKFIDMKPIGPNNSSVGFAEINLFFHNLTGVHMNLYVITDWLGLVPIAFVFGFGLLGLFQLIKRKSIFKVDSDILILGGFYIVVMAIYLLFEYVVINYRPILINGFLEASYPSSTTMLVMCVMPTALMQINSRIKNKNAEQIISLIIIAFILFMVIGRLISGVHWLSDIIGGALLSAGLVTIYSYFKK